MSSTQKVLRKIDRRKKWLMGHRPGHLIPAPTFPGGLLQGVLAEPALQLAERPAPPGHPQLLVRTAASIPEVRAVCPGGGQREQW